jgi:hypothetical protein
MRSLRRGSFEIRIAAQQYRAGYRRRHLRPQMTVAGKPATFRRWVWGSLRRRGKHMGLPTGIRRLALIAAAGPLAVAMTTVMLAGPASAAPSAKAALVHPAAAVITTALW